MRVSCVSKAAHRAFRLNLSMSVKYICLNVFAGRLLLFGEFVYSSVCLFSGVFVLFFDHFVSFVTLAILHLFFWFCFTLRQFCLFAVSFFIWQFFIILGVLLKL